LEQNLLNKNKAINYNPMKKILALILLFSVAFATDFTPRKSKKCKDNIKKVKKMRKSGQLKM
jgi:hypothetical protein